MVLPVTSDFAMHMMMMVVAALRSGWRIIIEIDLLTVGAHD